VCRFLLTPESLTDFSFTSFFASVDFLLSFFAAVSFFPGVAGATATG
jgi:hypothetical protein